MSYQTVSRYDEILIYLSSYLPQIIFIKLLFKMQFTEAHI